MLKNNKWKIFNIRYMCVNNISILSANATLQLYTVNISRYLMKGVKLWKCQPNFNNQSVELCRNERTKYVAYDNNNKRIQIYLTLRLNSHASKNFQIQSNNRHQK